ncbi:MAG: DUF1559 domain-containing protein [Planctomycetes bacterium]|nr:DUF1559 domain-containing protein [Planctomycetota bacterium]
MKSFKSIQVTHLGAGQTPCRRTGLRGFTVAELVVGVGAISLIVALLMPVISSVREKARVIDCINNLQEISAGLNVYKASFNRYPQECLDDFSPMASIVSDYNIFSCPSSPKDTESAGSLEGSTSYRYFGTRKDLHRKNLSYQGVSYPGEPFVPEDPGQGWETRRKFGAVYDREFTNHEDNCLNIIYLDDSHWERLCQAVAVGGAEVEGVEGDAMPDGEILGGEAEVDAEGGVGGDGGDAGAGADDAGDAGAGDAGDAGAGDAGDAGAGDAGDAGADNNGVGPGNNNGHGNNEDHDDEDNPGNGVGNHGADPGYDDDGIDDDEMGGGQGAGNGDPGADGDDGNMDAGADADDGGAQPRQRRGQPRGRPGLRRRRHR